jgi:hypothetical protein
MQLRHLICALTLLVAALALPASGCSLSASPGDPEDTVNSSGLLEAVERVQEAGLTPFWLGTRFPAGTASFALQPATEVLPLSEGPPALELRYQGVVTAGGPFYLTSAAKKGSGVEDARRKLLNDSGTKHEILQVGEWDAELFSLPSGIRPVNLLRLVVDTGDVYVIAKAYAVGNGIPGQDPNPLIDKDLLISVVAEHLRPYPE